MMSLETSGSVAYSRMPLSGPSAAAFDGGVDLVLGHVLLEERRQVGDRAVGHGHAEGVAGELAVQLGDHLADGLGGAGRGRDDVDRRGAGAVGVGVDLVGDALVVRVGVAGRHQALLDAEGLVEHLGHRGQAVRRARRVGDDPVLGLERVVVHAEDDRRVELVLGRGAEDRPARRRRRCASGATALLVKKPVDSRATWHAQGLPRQVGRVLLLGDLDLLAVDDQATSRRPRPCRRTGRGRCRTSAGGPGAWRPTGR